MNSENEKLRALLKEARVTFEMWKDVAPAISLCADIDRALSQQAEPAPAQDEREAFEARMRLGGYSNPEKHPDGSYVSSAMELWWQGWKAYAAWLRNRPAQTEQQPIRLPQRADTSHGDAFDTQLAEAYNAALDEVARLNAAPIAQTEQQPVAWRCRCVCDECTGADWSECSFEQYQMALADPEMQARPLYAAPIARADAPTP